MVKSAADGRLQHNYQHQFCPCTCKGGIYKSDTRIISGLDLRIDVPKRCVAIRYTLVMLIDLFKIMFRHVLIYIFFFSFAFAL